MKTPVKFVSNLSDEQIGEKKTIITNSTKSRVRERAHSILSRSEGFSIDFVTNICDLNRDTVSRWIDNWEQSGFDSCHSKPRPGGPCILTEAEKQLVLDLVKKHPRSVAFLVAIIFEKTQKRVSFSPIKRILKAAKLRWKRVRGVVPFDPNHSLKPHQVAFPN